MAGLLVATSTPQAAGQVFIDTFASGFQNGGAIPDGNLSGWSDTRSLSASANIAEVTVNLALTGGFNGDLYGYISHDGVLVPLLNRVGLSSTDSFAYGDPGLDVAFADGAPLGDIHFYQLAADFSSRITDGSVWEPDGRTLSPTEAAPSDYDSATRTTLSAFNGHVAGGPWTLFIADVSGGGGTSVLSRWGWQITAVPEPVQTLECASALLVVGTVRWWAQRRHRD
ncbi:MAG: PEP-CTERM sorting domain-containing protein [Verrucomicrobiales bacterium]|nr:PEP-CTERM sorting domain-containing protein [Verrucomicrobiales bacterium]